MAGITEYTYPNGLRVLLLPDSGSSTITVNVVVSRRLAPRRLRRIGHGAPARAPELHQEHARPEHQEGARRSRRALERHDLVRPHQLLRDGERLGREPALGARARGRAHGQHADREGAARHGDDRRPQRVRARREQRRPTCSRSACCRRRSCGTTTGSRRSARAPTSSACRSTGSPRSIASTTSPTTPWSSIAGQIDPAKTLAIVASTLGAIPRPTRMLDKTYTVEPPQDGERTVELRRVGKGKNLLIAYHSPAMAHPDAAALEVMSGILGSTRHRPARQGARRHQEGAVGRRVGLRAARSGRRHDLGDAQRRSVARRSEADHHRHARRARHARHRRRKKSIARRRASFRAWIAASPTRSSWRCS